MYRPSCLSYVLLVANMWSFAVCANAFIYGSYDPSHNIPIVALMTLCATGLWLSTSVVSFGIRYVRVRVSPEKTQNRTIYVSSGLPHFDPVYGVVKKCEPMGGGPAIELQVNPSWIHLLPTSPAINKVEVGQESAILGSTYSVVETGGEPKSLVAVKSGDSTLGFGARVYHEGMDVLMVPHHVWYNDKPHTALAKNGRSVDTEDWEVEAACADPRIDFVLVKVPTAVWAKLAVRSTKVLAPVHGTAVQTFGGQDSKQLFSGLGKAKALDNAWEFTHTAPTAKGWSGTPLYTRDGIVGMHTGYVDIGTSNRAINMHFIMSCLVSKMETLPPELGYREISLEDVGLRSFEFLEVEIENRGKVKLGKREFAWVPKGKAWADMLDDDDLPLPPKMVNGNLVWADAQESFDGALPLNLLAGGRTQCLAAQIELGDYKFSCGPTHETGGMPFRNCGSSTCKFREVSRKPVADAVTAATKVFPELSELGWPERGSGAEIGSLLLQAGKFVPTKAPSNLEQAYNNLLSRYPRSKPLACFRQGTWSFDAIFEQVVSKATSAEINQKASPGVPLSRLATTNKDLMAQHMQFVAACVTGRVPLLASFEDIHALSPTEMVEMGLCDPVRLFVKQEPHPSRKLKEGRYRLISSVSIVDQLVERMLFGAQNELEIAEWQSIPSKPGMGLSVIHQADAIFRDLRVKHTVCPAAEADISGFDWSVQDWELWADVEMRIVLGSFPPMMARAARNRFSCFMNSVLQLSNGQLLQQELPGIMKSGSYCTSSTNSRIRCLMAELIGSPWCIAMGDDSVEGFVEGAREKYAGLGHLCKDYKPCATTPTGQLYAVEFCSHVIKRNKAFLTSWPKTLYRFLSTPRETLEDLERELASSPMWHKIQSYVRSIPSPDKTARDKSICNGYPLDQEAISTSYSEYSSKSASAEATREAACCAGAQAYPSWGIHGPYCSGDHGEA
ncbi:polyprotein P2ab [Southern cowpea mosaic virus]|uniref:Replicase polyprotein P2AB n=5 Tax=Southern cowpea mosaic virus TaxID=196398 RepID=RDRP_SCPMV|nr:polyprotein P2ab [Southern cowpea mosaic virus]P21405.2 RecName: Full=Replicase polyprotein P2AB; Contains: RecName: Full=N-terminal protein; Contains: RecName: Full=Serine protease; Contains: RecName: Full=VPg; Contains: RecName: Full=RNA-directed RNA polymerase; AltName: Full=RdRp [Southern cowpea mosaic virus]